LLDILKFKTKEDVVNNMEQIIQAVIIIPNLVMDNMVSSKEVVKVVSDLIKLLVQEFPPENWTSQLLFLVHQAFSSIFLLNERKGSLDLDFDNFLNVLLPLIKSSVLAMQTFEIYINIMKMSVYEKNIDQIKNELIENLSSPYHQVMNQCLRTKY
jgi:hypothetical protein